MKPIGGYFELELPQREEYHKNAIRLNSGKNAFEYILRAKQYKKVYLPYYTCDVMLEPIQKLNIGVEFYHIDKMFRPRFNFNIIKQNEVFVFNNYFGICNKQVHAVAEQCENLIVDNSQAFFSKPLPGVDTFYSPRKFFGLPDGAYLYTNQVLDAELNQDVSFQRFEHLLGRIDVGAEAHYNAFKSNDESLINQPIKQMSNLTKRLLKSIDYIGIANKRRENFACFHSFLKETNEFDLILDDNEIPMVFPYLKRGNNTLRNSLIRKKIFTATYWPNVKQWLDDKNAIENYFHDDLIALPIDQRITLNHCNTIKQFLIEQ